MNNKWKKNNPEKLKWKVEDTPLRAKLPAVEEYLKLLPFESERIRILKLAGEKESYKDTHLTVKTKKQVFQIINGQEFTFRFKPTQKFNSHYGTQMEQKRLIK